MAYAIRGEVDGAVRGVVLHETDITGDGLVVTWLKDNAPAEQLAAPLAHAAELQQVVSRLLTNVHGQDDLPFADAAPAVPAAPAGSAAPVLTDFVREDLERLTVADLREIASGMHVDGAPRLNKTELIDAILGAQQGG